MDKLEKTITGHSQTMIMGLLIGSLLLAGLLLFLWRYSSVLSGMSQQAAKNPLQQNAISLAQIKGDYEVNFSRIINGYLASDMRANNFSSLTTQAKEQILNLRVPSQSETHLRTVLILSDIEKALAKSDLNAVSAKISELKKIDQEFLAASK